VTGDKSGQAGWPGSSATGPQGSGRRRLIPASSNRSVASARPDRREAPLLHPRAVRRTVKRGTNSPTSRPLADGEASPTGLRPAKGEGRRRASAQRLPRRRGPGQPGTRLPGTASAAPGSPEHFGAPGRCRPHAALRRNAGIQLAFGHNGTTTRPQRSTTHASACAGSPRRGPRRRTNGASALEGPTRDPQTHQRRFGARGADAGP
jgi:hypothetical protein